MRTLSGRILALISPVAVVCARPAQAHEREFTQSRDWHLPYKGEHEFELRSFIDTTHGDFRGQLEYEYGVTRHFAFEPGIEVKENEEGEQELEGADLELRFNLGEYRRGAWLPAFNLEYEHPFENDEADRLELKSVLSRYGERNDFTVNLNFGKELEGEREGESELTAGWVYKLTAADSDGQVLPSGYKLGLELVEDLEEHNTRAGPLVPWRANPHLHLLASYLPAIDDRGGDNFDQLSVILEWEL